eukprot:2637969-Prorocentrum_lima.AAC.1
MGVLVVAGRDAGGHSYHTEVLLGSGCLRNLLPADNRAKAKEHRAQEETVADLPRQDDEIRLPPELRLLWRLFCKFMLCLVPWRPP